MWIHAERIWREFPETMLWIRTVIIVLAKEVPVLIAMGNYTRAVKNVGR